MCGESIFFLIVHLASNMSLTAAIVVIVVIVVVVLVVLVAAGCHCALYLAGLLY